MIDGDDRKNTNVILNRLRNVVEETESEEMKIRLVCMIADLAICAAPNIKLSKDLLDTASQDLESLISDDSPIAEMFADLLKYVAVFIDASKSSSSRKSMPLKHLVATIEKLPSEPDLLESHLERREKQGKALAELRRLLSNGESSRAQLDKLLVSVIDTLGSGRRRPVVETETISSRSSNATSSTRETKSTEYLLRFLRYLVEVGSQIRSAGLDSPDIVSVLRKEPWHMVADVVFKHNGWKQARSLAELMQLDLVKIILRASSTASLVGEEKENIDYEGHEMSMSVVEFLSSLEGRAALQHQSLLAALSCVLRVTNERIGCNFVSYALKRKHRSSSSQQTRTNNMYISKTQIQEHPPSRFFIDGFGSLKVSRLHIS